MLTFVVMLLAVALMMIGIFRGRKLKGSCGGISCASCRGASACRNKTASKGMSEEPDDL